MLTRLTPVATLIDTKQQSATTRFRRIYYRFRNICEGVDPNSKLAHIDSLTHSILVLLRRKICF